MLDGRTIRCDRWGADEAQRSYDRAIAEWLSAGRRLPVHVDEQITVIVLGDRFMQHAEQHYRRPDGSPTTEHGTYQQTVKPMLTLDGDEVATDFTPRCLRAVRQKMIDAGWSRRHMGHLTPTLRAMVNVQRLTGMRPAEVCALTTGIIDTRSSGRRSRCLYWTTAWTVSPGTRCPVAAGPNARSGTC